MDLVMHVKIDVLIILRTYIDLNSKFCQQGDYHYTALTEKITKYGCWICISKQEAIRFDVLVYLYMYKENMNCSHQ